MIGLYSDEYFMKEAMKQAAMAMHIDEVPVGAVIVAGTTIIARAHNMTEKLNDVTAHAEMLALTAAANHLGAKYLNDCTLYVTLEPCAMCAAALGWAQIGKIVWAASDPKKGFTQISHQLLHPKALTKNGIMENEASEMLKEFFRKKR